MNESKVNYENIYYSSTNKTRVSVLVLIQEDIVVSTSESIEFTSLESNISLLKNISVELILANLVCWYYPCQFACVSSKVLIDYVIWVKAILVDEVLSGSLAIRSLLKECLFAYEFGILGVWIVEVVDNLAHWVVKLVLLTHFTQHVDVLDIVTINKDHLVKSTLVVVEGQHLVVCDVNLCLFIRVVLDQHLPIGYVYESRPLSNDGWVWDVELITLIS